MVFSLFRKKQVHDDSPSTVKLENVTKWLRSVLSGDVANHVSMVTTVFGEMKRRTQEVRRGISALERATIKKEDFLDVPHIVERYKQETIRHLMLYVDELEKILAQDSHTIEDCVDTFDAIKQTMGLLDKALHHHYKTLSTYYHDMKDIKASVTALQHDIVSIEDILTSPLFKQFADVREHVAVALRKIETQSLLEKKRNEVQTRIDDEYKEFLQLETKMNDIRTSNRYRLEQQAIRGAKPNNVAHFSVMEHELKELRKRKEMSAEKLEHYKTIMKAITDKIQANDPQPHLERIMNLLKQLTRVQVDIVVQ